MDNDIDLSIAMNILNRKIAELNMKMLNDDKKEIQDELDKYLKIKDDIYNGDVLLVQKLINGEI